MQRCFTAYFGYFLGTSELVYNAFCTLWCATTTHYSKSLFWTKMEVPKCSSIVACLILELLLSTFYNSVKSSRLDFFKRAKNGIEHLSSLLVFKYWQTHQPFGVQLYLSLSTNGRHHTEPKSIFWCWCTDWFSWINQGIRSHMNCLDKTVWQLKNQLKFLLRISVSVS